MSHDLKNSSVIDAITHSGEKDGPERAQSIIEEMLEKVKAGSNALTPTTITVNAVLYAFAKSEKKNAGRLAENFLIKMMEMQHTLGEEKLKPNTISYTTVSNSPLKYILNFLISSITICVYTLDFGGY